MTRFTPRLPQYPPQPRISLHPLLKTPSSRLRGPLRPSRLCGSKPYHFEVSTAKTDPKSTIVIHRSLPFFLSSNFQSQIPNLFSILSIGFSLTSTVAQSFRRLRRCCYSGTEPSDSVKICTLTPFQTRQPYGDAEIRRWLSPTFPLKLLPNQATVHRK